MRSFWNTKTLVICVVLLTGASSLSYVAVKEVRQRRLAAHLESVRIQAERGDAQAETELGHIYYRALGVPQDFSESALWFRKAADQGEAKAQYSLGYMYWYGQGVPKDATQAVLWYRKAADQGEPRAESALGSAYYYGQGVQQDRPTAASWYRRAADQGIPDAQYDLGYMVYYGQGVPQDRAEANRLFTEAADQGNENARRALGMKRALSVWNKVFLVLDFGGGSILFAMSLPRKDRVHNRARRITFLAGLFALTHGGLTLSVYLLPSIQHSSIWMLLVARDLLGGAVLALLFPIVLTPKTAKIAAVVSCLLFVLYCIVAFAAHQNRFVFLAFSWFVGMSVTSAILLKFDRQREVSSQNGMDRPTIF
jgi:hypothetical protein